MRCLHRAARDGGRLVLIRGHNEAQIFPLARNLLIRLLKLRPGDLHLHIRMAQLMEQRIQHYGPSICQYRHALSLYGSDAAAWFVLVGARDAHFAQAEPETDPLLRCGGPCSGAAALPLRARP